MIPPDLARKLGPEAAAFLGELRDSLVGRVAHGNTDWNYREQVQQGVRATYQPASAKSSFLRVAISNVPKTLNISMGVYVVWLRDQDTSMLALLSFNENTTNPRDNSKIATDGVFGDIIPVSGRSAGETMIVEPGRTILTAVMLPTPLVAAPSGMLYGIRLPE